jgi:ABC-type transport system involved in cytochrome bd biosynthesis fused ATPase/permease subunit
VERFIKVGLKEKGLVIVTHALAYLKEFDYIYVMDNGAIVEEGDFQHISQTPHFKLISTELQLRQSPTPLSSS